MGHQSHREAGKSIVARCAIITLSDSRTADTDKSGARIRELVENSGHTVSRYQLIPDDPSTLDALLAALSEDAETDVILSTGGTGISARDNTVTVVHERLDRVLPGFGELFRMLSFKEIGSAAMLSGAVGGILHGKLVFAMPGSTAAVELAMNKLILPELRHLLHELRK